MTQLENELRKRKVADAAGIIDEYGQRFAFKMADGYSEEEIAARLGDPTALAARFGETGTAAKKTAGKPLVVVGLGLAAIAEILFFILLTAWGVVMAAASVSSAALAVCLIGGINVAGVIPAAVLARGNLGAVVCAAERAHRSRLRVLLGVRAPARALVRQVQAQCACLGNG